jgi:hypothetical protein
MSDEPPVVPKSDRTLRESGERIRLQRVEGEQVILLLLLQLNDGVELPSSPGERHPERPVCLVRLRRRSDRCCLRLVDLISARGVVELPFECEAFPFEACDLDTEPEQCAAPRELRVRKARRW